MEFFGGGACLKKIRACPFSKASGPGLVHEKMFSWSPVHNIIFFMRLNTVLDLPDIVSRPELNLEQEVDLLQQFENACTVLKK